jgi:pimeloyl-ACP methyl ester carboxylesterase
MQTIHVDGASLSTLALGRDGGTPLLMLHGLIAGNMATWYSAYATPLSRERRVLLYDQRGHGDSSLPARGFDLDTQVADLIAVREHHRVNGEAIDIVGHSMGALIALHYALRYPQLVNRLVLIDAPMPAHHHVAPSLLAVTSPEALTAYVDSEMPTGNGRRRERLLRRLSALFFESTLMQDVMAMNAEPDAALAALDVPTLLIYGTHSPCLAAGLHLQRTLPNARLERVDSGHYIPEEAPAPLRALLDGFLSNAVAAEA